MSRGTTGVVARVLRLPAAAAATACALLVLAGSAGAGGAAAHLYWVVSDKVGVANLDGSGTNTSFVSGVSNGQSVAVDDQHVYWVSVNTPAIGRADLDGSNANQSLVSENASDVAVDSQYLYWTDTADGTIGRANLDGSSPDASFITGLSGPRAIATDGTYLYWANAGGGHISRADLNGSNLVSDFIDAGAQAALGVAVELPYIYWTEFSNGTIGRANIDGTGVNESFVTGLSQPVMIAADGRHLYWTGTGHTIGEANLDGTGVNGSVVTAGSDIPTSVAVLSSPGAPMGASATVGAASASVAFGAPSPNGSSITGYTVTSSPGGVTASGVSSPIAVSGLTNGTAYTFTVTATNGVGEGVASAASNEVTPSADPVVATFAPLSGIAGTHVTLTGTGLDTVNEVDFTNAASPATIDTQSAARLVVEVPPDATFGPLTVKNGVGQAVTSKSFTPVPKIASLGAYDGAVFNVVAINGTNLAGATVKFGTVAATPIPVSATEVDARVPLAGFSIGKVSVTTTPGGTAMSPQPFAVTKIASFAPLSATAGKTVTITGQGLGSTTSVDFVGHTGATIVGTPTATSVKVIVPDDAAVGDIFVNTANTPLGSVLTVKVFKPLPSISNLSPVDGQPGTPVEIIGANFVNVGGVIKFGKVEQTSFTVATPTEIDTTVPAPGFTGGAVTVTTTAGTVVSKAIFTLTTVSGFTPAAAPAGATVTIHGQGLADATAVDFVGHAGVAPVGTPTATSIKVVVPDDALPGQLLVHTPGTDPGGLLTANALKVVPTISTVTPVDGMEGTSVTITGANFFTDVNTVVMFGTIPLVAYTVMSPNTIIAPIPAGFTSGKVTVTTPGGGTAVSKTVVNVTKVTAISPAKGAAGQKVTITGQGLGSTTGVNFTGPTIGGLFTLPVPATIVSVSATTVTVTVPAGAVTGPLTLFTPRIGLAGIQTVQSFAPLPTVGMPTPTPAGTLVFISGGNLQPTAANPTVTLGTESVTVLFAFPTFVGLLLPPDAITGTLTVTTANGTAKTTLKVLPTISSGPDPSHAAAGDEVHLTGLTFTGTKSVTFAGNASTPFTVTGALGSTQTLTFKVPATAASGPITVTNAGGSAATAGDFTVDPHIASFTPASAADGATVTLTGSGFGLNGDTRTIKVGSIAATSVTWVSPTSVKFVIPNGAPVSDKIHIAVNGGTAADSATNLNVTATIASFTPSHGPAGTPVVISGSGFTGATGVKFNGVAAASFHVDSATQITATVPSGTSPGAITVARPTVPKTLTSATNFDNTAAITSISLDHGHAGDDVTVIGTDLTGATTVTFGGGATATASSVTATSLHVTVPDTAETGELTVTTPLGDAVSSTSFTVEPEIDSFTPTDGPPGTSVVITGSGFTGATDVAFGGASAGDGNYSVDSATQITATVPAGAATGTITVTTPDGNFESADSFTVDDFVHSNGLGQTYLSANLLGTYSSSDAQAALQAWPGSSGPSFFTCNGEDAVATAATSGDNQGAVAVWVYGAGPLQGHVFLSPAPHGVVTCPLTSDPTWN